MIHELHLNKWICKEKRLTTIWQNNYFWGIEFEQKNEKFPQMNWNFDWKSETIQTILYFYVPLKKMKKTN